jgi:hypothetical protein
MGKTEKLTTQTCKGTPCGDTFDIQEAIGGGYIVLVNGFQSGDDEDKFDYSIGCSSQIFPDKSSAKKFAKSRGMR